MKPQVLWCLLLWSRLCCAVDVYGALGQPLTLRPALQGPIKSLEWKRNRNLLVEWDGKIARRYDDRVSLDESNGVLKFVPAVATDAGNFTLSLNAIQHDEVFVVKVIRHVPEPEVQPNPLACSKKFENCTLHCGGNTSGAEPITYSWKTEPVTNMTGRNWNIDRTSDSIRSFICIMQNPLGQRESQAFPNPFYRKKTDPGLEAGEIMGVIVGVIVPVGVILTALVYLWCKKQSNAENSERNGSARSMNMEESKSLRSDN